MCGNHDDFGKFRKAKKKRFGPIYTLRAAGSLPPSCVRGFLYSIVETVARDPHSHDDVSSSSGLFNFVVSARRRRIDCVINSTSSGLFTY